MEEIFIPATGMTMEDAELVAWLKQPGESVAAGDPIATIETDKVTVDVNAETDGVLDVHLFEAGALVNAGVVITRVLHSGDAPSGAGEPPATAPEPAPAAPAPPAAPEVVAAAPVAAPAAEPTSPAAVEPLGPDGRPRRPHTLTPRRRREARERAEAQKAAPPAPSAALPAPAGPRKSDAVAKAVTESWATIPHFAVSREIDVTGMLHYLDDLRAAGAEVTVTDLLLRAAARSWSVLRPSAPDALGLLVATPRRAINVTVQGASSADLPSIATRRSAVVERARRGLLKPGDLAAAEFSVSNLGTHDVDWFTGIIPTGQLALFTIGRVRDGVQLVAGKVVARRTLWVTVNLDHREFDGADAAELLAAFAAACTITLTDPTATEDRQP